MLNGERYVKETKLVGRGPNWNDELIFTTSM